MADVQHPPEGELLRFSQGSLDDEACARIESHVSTCQECVATLETFPPDRLAERLADELPHALADHPRYRPVRRVGEGGMGVVYLADDLNLPGCSVAIKVMPADQSRDAAAINKRLGREVKNAVRLDHPNIVRALDHQVYRGLPFLVMEHVDGVDLAEHVQYRGPIPWREACDYVRQVAQGLQHAHERGMIHRDIKPQNLLLRTDGIVKICDFGLAKLRSGKSLQGTTRSGLIMGTPDTMAPEQANDPKSTDIRADIYALGCSFYYLITGTMPFPEKNLVDTLSAHAHKQPQPIHELRSDVPQALVDVIGTMMAKRPELRQQTPAEVVLALEAVIRDAESEQAPRAVPIQASRARLARFSVIAAVLALIAASIVWYMGRDPGDRLPPAGFSLAAVGEPPPASAAGRALFVLEDEFWPDDYFKVRPKLAGMGYKITVAAPHEGELRPSRGDRGARADVTLVEVDASQIAVVIFGGRGDAYRKRQPLHAVAQALMNEVRDNGGCILGIGKGVVVLAEAGVLSGRRTAVQPQYADDVITGGGIVSERRLEADEGIITVRSTGSLDGLTHELAQQRSREQRHPAE